MDVCKMGGCEFWRGLFLKIKLGKKKKKKTGGVSRLVNESDFGAVCTVVIKLRSDYQI